MSSSLSPDHYGSSRSQNSPDGTSSGGQDRNATSSLNLGFFKSLADKRANRDGNPPKRRGPKPDSKPALTRRQELNRQAQRTHRERKELYIKALEDEVLRLKELYSSVSQEKDRLADENRRLKDVLAHRGTPFPTRAAHDDASANFSAAHRSTTTSPFAPTSQSTLSPSRSTAPSVASSSAPPALLRSMTGAQMRDAAGASRAAKGIDFEQAGIDFVLALEKPCMQHMPFLLDRATEADGDPCGHALMASCPPRPFESLTPDTPFGSSHTRDRPDGPNPAQGTWELSRADLATLLDLSAKLELDGEITPVMAWGMLLSHPRFADCGAKHFQRLAEELGRKVRCYGFGAVLEEFELRDAVESVLPCEPESAVC